MSAQEFISEVWGLQGAAYGVLGLQYYARISTSGWSGLAWDDFCIMLAMVRLTLRCHIYLGIQTSKINRFGHHCTVAGKRILTNKILFYYSSPTRQSRS